MGFSNYLMFKNKSIAALELDRVFGDYPIPTAGHNFKATEQEFSILSLKSVYHISRLQLRTRL